MNGACARRLGVEGRVEADLSSPARGLLDAALSHRVQPSQPVIDAKKDLPCNGFRRTQCLSKVSISGQSRSARSPRSNRQHQSATDCSPSANLFWLERRLKIPICV